MNRSGMRSVFRAVLALYVVVVVLCSWLAPLDSAAIQQVDAGMKRALATFATARALNAVISVAQGTEVSIQPLGFGVNFTPGQLLDPVNDLVEQFSNLMLAATIAFGVQRVFIAIGAHWLISLVLTAAVLVWASFRFRQRPAPAWLSGVLVVMLMIRFAVPIATVGTDVLFSKFLANDYGTSQQAIDIASGQAAKLNPPVVITPENQGMVEKMKAWWSQSMDVKTRFENLKLAAEQATEHIIKLMVIFLLQTLILPLLLLWAMYGIARRVLNGL